jgi:hypothetical protein
MELLQLVAHDRIAFLQYARIQSRAEQPCRGPELSQLCISQVSNNYLDYGFDSTRIFRIAIKLLSVYVLDAFLVGFSCDLRLHRNASLCIQSSKNLFSLKLTNRLIDSAFSF